MLNIAQKPKWDEWNTIASYTTHLTKSEKTRQSSFPNRVLAVMVTFQILYVPVSKPDVPVFTD
jgi:hypothetical protein